VYADRHALLCQMDVAEEIGKRKDRAKRFGLPVPVFAAEVSRRRVLSIHFTA